MNKGNLPWPVERGVIIQRFGLQPHPVVRTTKIQSNGIVIATTKNAEVDQYLMESSLCFEIQVK